MQYAPKNMKKLCYILGIGYFSHFNGSYPHHDASSYAFLDYLPNGMRNRICYKDVLFL